MLNILSNVKQNFIALLSNTEILKEIWDIMSSKIAIIIYVVGLLVLIITIIILVLVSEIKRQDTLVINHSQNIIKNTIEESSDGRKKRRKKNKRKKGSNPLDNIKTDNVQSVVNQNFEQLAIGATSDGLGNGTDEKKEEIVGDEESRFYMLTKIDNEAKEYVAPNYNDDITLEEVCESFRNFSSCRLGLYYDIKDIRRFIAGLSVTHLMILQGMSGTGKTSLAYAFGEFLDNSTVIIPIQPMWKERSDLIGYYNEFTKKFNETMLLQKLYEANYNDEIYITVLDELNIARIEYYFAEFLSLLEIPNYEKRNLDVVADEWSNDPKLLHNGQLRLPKNMWFIGTANNDDSTFAISDKVYDRAMVINLDKKAKPFEVLEADGLKISSTKLLELFTRAQKKYRLSRRNLNRIRQLDKYLIDNFHLTFGNRIMKQIKSYVPVIVACGGTELDALDDILSKKVLRKLEAKNPVYVRSASAGLIRFIEDLFGEDRMPQCKEYIQTIEQN